MTAPTPNAELAYRVLDHIDAHPEQHNQRVWIEDRGDCGTAACMAGWTCLLSGDQPRFHGDGDPEAEFVIHAGVTRGDYIPDRAAELLGMKPDGGAQTGFRLFEPSNTREDLGRLVAEIFGPRPEPTVVTCSHCRTPFDPADTAFDGRAQHASTPWCRRCVDRCHEATDPAHTCTICTAGGAR
jgi:hypothetical protein